MEAHKCGGLVQRDIIFTNLLSMPFVFGLFAEHGIVCATQKADMEHEETQYYGADMKEKAGLW